MKDDYSRICNDLAATWKADFLCNNAGRASVCYDWRVRNGLDNGVIHPNALAIVMGGTYLTKVEHHEAHWRSQPGYALMLAAAIEAAFPVLPVERAPVLRGGFDAELVGDAISKLYANTRPESGKLFYSREEQATHTVLWLKENGFSELVITSEQLAAAMGNWLYSWQGYRDFAAMAIALHQAANHLRKPGNSVNPAAGASTNVVASRYNRSPSRAVRIARAARGHRKRGCRGH